MYRRIETKSNETTCCSYVAPHNPIANLRAGLDGIKQILHHSLPGLQWSQYDAHGRPVEDALTFQLMADMTHIPQVATRLFDPKLVDLGTSARRPDIYTSIHQ